MSRIRISKTNTIMRIRFWAADNLLDPADNTLYPAYCLNQEVAAQSSYARTAVSELIKEIEKSDKEPMVVIEEFIQRMDKWSLTNKNTSIVFSVSHDVVQALYDDLYLRG